MDVLKKTNYFFEQEAPGMQLYLAPVILLKGPADELFVNATENDVENLDQSPPADSEIELARCHLEGCYPPPSKITFQALNGEYR